MNICADQLGPSFYATIVETTRRHRMYYFGPVAVKSTIVKCVKILVHNKVLSMWPIAWIPTVCLQSQKRSTGRKTNFVKFNFQSPRDFWNHRPCPIHGLFVGLYHYTNPCSD